MRSIQEILLDIQRKYNLCLEELALLTDVPTSIIEAILKGEIIDDKYLTSIYQAISKLSSK